MLGFLKKMCHLWVTLWQMNYRRHLTRIYDATLPKNIANEIRRQIIKAAKPHIHVQCATNWQWDFWWIGDILPSFKPENLRKMRIYHVPWMDYVFKVLLSLVVRVCALVFADLFPCVWNFVFFPQFSRRLNIPYDLSWAFFLVSIKIVLAYQKDSL